MYKVVLLNLPFSNAQFPSIALTQLKYVVDEKFCGAVTTEICYLNHDFVHYLGLDLYQEIIENYRHLASGLGEWFFRQTAFPTLPDNAEEYLQRYYAGLEVQAPQLYHLLLEKRRGLEAFLDELIAKYSLSQAHLVGLTSTFSQNLACFSMSRKLKEAQPEIVIVMGGANCETPMGEEIIKNVKTIDFVFSGPALISFPQFIEYRLNYDFKSCHQIPGVFSRTNCLPGSRACPPQVGPGTIGQERDINEIVELDYRSFLQDVKAHFPHKEITPILLFETSRGCWWGERSHCTFCGLNGLSMNYRVMSPQKAVSTIQSLFNYADECFSFICVDNILPRKYTQEVLPLLNTPSNVSFYYEVKADLSEQDIRVLSQARVKTIQPGIEALSTSILKLMKKGTTAFQNLRLLKHCATHEVFPLWNILIGFPGEKEEVYHKYLHDLPLFCHLPPPTAVYPIRFDRYSPYFTRAGEYGLDLMPFAFYELIYPWNPESLTRLAYYFTDQNQQADYIMMVNKWFGKMREQVEQWRSRWWARGMGIVLDKWYQADHPQLLFKQQGNDTLIYDSRSGKPLEYQISSTRMSLLQYLDQPHKMVDLIAKFAHLSLQAIEQEIAFLQDRGLLFEEDDRFLSLVLPGRPSLGSRAVRQTIEQHV